MMAFTHIAAGAVSALTLSNFLHTPATQTTLFLAGGVLGSLLPDIDHPASALGRRVLPLSLMLAAIFGHRGITHSLVAVVAMSLAAWYSLHGLDWYPGYSVPVVLGLSVGYLSHLLADWMTNTGVPLAHEAALCGAGDDLDRQPDGVFDRARSVRMAAVRIRSCLG
jgi:inner membrane protein